MSAVVTGVLEGSLAQRGGVLVGDTLLSVNGNAVADVLDYQFYLADTQASMKFLDQTGRIKHVRIRKGEYEDVGLCFETYLMDEKRSCRNRCIFCFIDQLPPGMRPSLYFKDDDARLSFLMGNYITLSGLTGRELRRITEMHLSPVNISVHATDPQLRVKMMRNPEAGRALGIMKHLAGHHIKMNCQIVLCRGINDGEALSRTLGDLS
ncbi:MAG: PDZ domain-containing protein, partial [Clostridia bacterium]|nr:PDZ domain-containing protein [Clostridia bacterium]